MRGKMDLIVHQTFHLSQKSKVTAEGNALFIGLKGDMGEDPYQVTRSLSEEEA